MVTIRSELRVNDQNEPEIWANLGDILDWLKSLPEQTDYPSAAGAALETRQMLLDCVGDAKMHPAEAN